MTAFHLLQSVAEFLRQVVQNYAASQGADKAYAAPRVFEWYLPFKNPQLPEKIDFPYIVARITGGNDPVLEPASTTMSTVGITLAFGVYNEGGQKDGFLHPDGAYDLLNLMEHVRIELFRQRVINNRFVIGKPYEWEIPEDQPYPLWVGQAKTIWTVQSATEQPKGDDIHAIRFPWE